MAVRVAAIQAHTIRIIITTAIRALTVTIPTAAITIEAAASAPVPVAPQVEASEAIAEVFPAVTEPVAEVADIADADFASIANLKKNYN